MGKNCQLVKEDPIATYVLQSVVPCLIAMIYADITSPPLILTSLLWFTRQNR